MISTSNLERCVRDCELNLRLHVFQLTDGLSIRHWTDTHFFYTIQPHPPYRMLATTAEFCIEADQDSEDCESVQFVSGLVLRDDSELLLAYGINDCDAKLGQLSLSRVRQMLRPLEDERGVCSESHPSPS